MAKGTDKFPGESAVYCLDQIAMRRLVSSTSNKLLRLVPGGVQHLLTTCGPICS